MKYLLAVMCVCMMTVHLVTSQELGAFDERARISPNEDPGHNTHQEAVIFACLGVIVVLAVLCTLILWFVVERTKSDIRRLDKIIPGIAERMRKETFTANGELMSGTLTASHEFETEFLTNEEVQLTSYRRRKEEETAAEASAPEVEPANGNVPRDNAEEDRDTPQTEVVNKDDQNDGGRHSQRRERSERSERNERHNQRHSVDSQERRSNQRNSYERHSYDPHSTPHDYADVALRHNHAQRSRPPPPSYRHTYDATYDNPVLCMQDERDFRRVRRNGPTPTPAPKPANRSSRPVSAYVTSGSEYPEEAPRPISIIGIMGDDEGKRPRRHGHGRRYKSLLYESHV